MIRMQSKMKPDKSNQTLCCFECSQKTIRTKEMAMQTITCDILTRLIIPKAIPVNAGNRVGLSFLGVIVTNDH